MTNETIETNEALQPLEGKQTIATLQARINELLAMYEGVRTELDELKSRPSRGRRERDYGPQSQNPMTEEMAWRIMFGDLKSAKVKDIAEDNGFSRGQIYSVRGSYTFTHVKQDSFMIVDDVIVPNTEE